MTYADIKEENRTLRALVMAAIDHLSASPKEEDVNLAKFLLEQMRYLDGGK